MTPKIQGIQAVRAKLKSHFRAAAAAGKAEAQRQAEAVAADMRMLAPKDELELVRSIRVTDAETVTVGKRDARKDVGFIGVVIQAGDDTTIVTNRTGAQFQNARIQEFGTQSRQANPYFYPAWRLSKRRVRAAISRSIRKAWTDG